MARAPLQVLLAGILVMLGGLPSPGRGLDILMITTVATRSHYIWSSALTNELLARGHRVTELTTMLPPKPHPNRTTYHVENAFTAYPGGASYDLDLVTQIDLIGNIKMISDWSSTHCEHETKSDGAKALLRDVKKGDVHADIIVIDYVFQQCFLGFADLLGHPPIVAMTAYGNPVELAEVVYLPVFPAYTPHDVLSPPGDRPMDLLTRAFNLVLFLYDDYQRWFHLFPKMDAVSRDFFGPDASTVSQLMERIDLVLVNSHPALHGVRLTLPAMKEVGGMHLQKPKPLPKDLQEWLDGAEHGAVLWSFGSVIQSKMMSPQKRRAVMAALGRLPQRVLWKYEEEWDPKDGPLPANVQLHKWLPQNDILAHPNLRLFVSHCGGLSTLESAFSGVPVLGIPFFMDQFINAGKLAALGGSMRLAYSDLTEESLYDALVTLTADSRPLERMRSLSAVLRDSPIPPLDSAAYWVEYTARHGGARHLRSPAALLSWPQRYLLDVAAVLLVAALAVVWALCRTCCLLRSLTQWSSQQQDGQDAARKKTQ